jgi:isoamyl acetate esterase
MHKYKLLVVALVLFFGANVCLNAAEPAAAPPADAKAPPADAKASPAKEQPPSGLDAWSAKDVPLKKGEVIVFFGDSITQFGAQGNGYCRLIANAIAKDHADLEVKPVYAGVGGHKVPDLQKRLDRDVISQKPTVVFIYIGINDVWHYDMRAGTPKETYESGLRDLVKKIKDAGAVVVLATPSVINERTDGTNTSADKTYNWDKMLEEYSEITRKVAADSDVQLCDLHKAFVEYLKKNNPDNKDRGVLTQDGVHLNPTGNKFVADLTSDAIIAALKKRK